MHDRGEVDRRAGVLRVLVVQDVHVAEPEHRVAHAEGGEIHHRVADVSELEVEDGGDATVLMMELAGVPHHGRLATLRVDGVAGQPAEHELEEGVGPRLGGPVAGDVHLHADQTRLRRRRRPGDAGAAVPVGVELVQAGEDAHVLVHHRRPLVVGGGVEVVLAGHAVGDERARIVGPAVDVGDRNAVLLEQLLELHLVLEREERRRIGPVAAHHHRGAVRRRAPRRRTTPAASAPACGSARRFRRGGCAPSR